MTSENLKIIPNYLNYYTFTELVNQINDTHFPWNYPQGDNWGEPCQYVNLLYYDHQFSSAMNPKLMRCIRAITDQLNAISILRVKVNATPTNAPEQSWHTDWQLSTPDKTCVIYLNDNDGYTEFRDGENILSGKNPAVIFDGNLEHRGVAATNVDRRLVLNINYFEK